MPAVADDGVHGEERPGNAFCQAGTVTTHRRVRVGERFTAGYRDGMQRSRWSEYLTGFHAARAGITERVLSRVRDDADGDPYAWLAAVVPGCGAVLDLACGNAALRPYLPHRAYVGVDLSVAELAAGRDRVGSGGLVRARADALPLADASVATVVCSMGLQVLTPLPVVVAEMARVLVPGGRLVCTVPERGPLRGSDLPLVAGLLAALGRGLSYPNDPVLRQLPQVLAAAGLAVRCDERRRFGYPLRPRADADLFAASLYLPEVPAWRERAARVLLRGYGRLGVRFPVPVRRIVAVRD